MTDIFNNSITRKMCMKCEAEYEKCNFSLIDNFRIDSSGGKKKKDFWMLMAFMID